MMIVKILLVLVIGALAIACVDYLIGFEYSSAVQMIVHQVVTLLWGGAILRTIEANR